MFGSIVSEDFYHAYSYTTTAISTVSNALLIYILLATHVVHVGPYRYLLLTFSIVDVIISFVHLALIPAIHMTKFGYIYWGYRFLRESTAVGVWAGLTWVLLFYQTFVLLAFHYVYRYVMLCSPEWLSWFRRRPWRNWLIVTFVADVIFVGGIFLACLFGFVPTDVSRKAFAPVLRKVYNIDLFASNAPGFLGIVYWTINEKGQKQWIPFSLFIIGCVCFLFFTTALIMLACIMQIFKELRASRFANLAPATKRMQKQLFRTLLWQTVIPCITSYTPLAMVFLVPLTGIPLGGFGTVFIMSTALFPMLDPYIVIFLISGYRKALIGLLANVIKPTLGQASHQVARPFTDTNSQITTMNRASYA
ncbi:str-129 [Pristionchus pacificus]|uniref:Str-129 protein n=1 Tax=Pristionchus pacificus TaxID=54126 RepID=A0A454Y548_PRIPA|nr:str-129 [Pristionchus pacificus]|eukprot:PDM78325.1 str-129 protein [Pristionchus pacificus]